MKKKVAIDELTLGMFVRELDRPWTDTPFSFQGFVISSGDELTIFKKYCKFVFIDSDKGLDVEPALAPLNTPERNKESETADSAASHAAAKKTSTELRLVRKVAYKNTVNVETEITKSGSIRKQAKQVVDNLYSDVKLGNNIDVQGAKAVVEEIVDSIVRNPDAQLLLTQLKNKDEYTAIHSMNVSILSMAFARHLGMDRDTICEVGLGAMFHDLGKIKVPLEILNKPSRLTPEEFKEMMAHPVDGWKLLLEAPDEIPPRVMQVAHSHHERWNGEGYPDGLKEEEIPLFARIVSIADVYDAITSSRVYHHGLSSADAMRSLYDERHVRFDEALVEQFIECIGIYPIGSMVELNSGEVGVIISVNRDRRLKPKVLLILDGKKHVYNMPKILDLSMFDSEKSDHIVEVRRILDPGTFGIEVADYLKDLTWVSKNLKAQGSSD